MKGHPGILYMDHYEPSLITQALAQAVPATAVPLNTWGKADYYMVDPAGNERMIERKQLSEALSDINAVEEQLGRHLHECAELTLLVEGVGMPSPTGVQTYNYGGGRWTTGHKHANQPRLWKRWMGFKHSLRHNAGIEVEETSHWWGSIQFISTWFHKSMDPTSTTMARYVIPHMAPFDKDPQVDNLCRLKGVGIREITAIKLIAEFGSLYGVITARYADLVGVMGGAWTRTFFEAIGREY
tara:strand:+ start:5569 stop:6291 length:723 start_codon:yes stop_codon:yes gene_type:complete